MTRDRTASVFLAGAFSIAILLVCVQFGGDSWWPFVPWYVANLPFTWLWTTQNGREAPDAPKTVLALVLMNVPCMLLLAAGCWLGFLALISVVPLAGLGYGLWWLYKRLAVSRLGLAASALNYGLLGNRIEQKKLDAIRGEGYHL